MSESYYQDIDVGFVLRSCQPYVVSEAEIIEFGRRFDPRPFHVDPVAAKQSVFGGLVAPGCLVFALRSKLMNELQPPIVYLAGLGLENMELPHPVRPGDQLTLTIECLDRRESRSRADAGIVRFGNTMFNQDKQTVLTMIAKVMVAKK